MKIEFYSEILINRSGMLCEQSGITKVKLFSLCGLNKNIVNNLKNGSVPSVDKIAVIADYFNVSVDYLLGRTNEPAAALEIDTDEHKSVTPAPVSVSETKPDGVTSEFFRAFETLDWSDKLDTMQFVRERMRKESVS